MEHITIGEWEDIPEGERVRRKDLCENKCFGHSCKCHEHLSKRGMEKLAKAKQDKVDFLSRETNFISHEALRRYFVRLTQYGYYNYESTYRLLALMMLNSFRQEFACYFNKTDEGVIERLLNCLYCSICAIPSPDYVVETQLNTLGNTRKDYQNYYE